MIIVSRKPIMAGYQLLVFKMLYIYVMLICDTLINYYLLTYLPNQVISAYLFQTRLISHTIFNNKMITANVFLHNSFES